MQNKFIIYLTFLIVLTQLTSKINGSISNKTLNNNEKNTNSHINFTSNYYEYSNFTFNSSKTNNKSPLVGLPLHTVVVSTIFYSLTLIVGLVGNALVIIVVCYNKNLQHNTNYCLVNLSVADLILIIVCMPSAILDLFSKEVWYFGYFMCKIISWLENSVSNVAVLTTVAISFERCFAIMFPFKAKTLFTKRRIFIAVIFIWISSTIFSLPMLTASRFFKAYHREFRKEVHVCYQVFNTSWLLNYLFISLGLFYLFPCVLLCVLYLKIVFVIRNRNNEKLSEQNLESNSRSRRKSSTLLRETIITNTQVVVLTNSNKTLKQSNNIHLPKINEKQIIVLLIVMMMLIFICLLPIRVFTVWFALSTKEQRQKLGIINYSILLTFCRVMFYLNSVLNPFFYHFMSSKFQNAFKDFFKSHHNHHSKLESGLSHIHTQSFIKK